MHVTSCPRSTDTVSARVGAGCVAAAMASSPSMWALPSTSVGTFSKEMADREASSEGDQVSEGVGPCGVHTHGVREWAGEENAFASNGGGDDDDDEDER